MVSGTLNGLFASILRKAITVLKDYFRFLMMLQRRKENTTEKGAVDPTGIREIVSVQTPDRERMVPELEPLIDPALIMSAQAEYMRLDRYFPSRRQSFDSTRAGSGINVFGFVFTSLWTAAFALSFRRD